MKKLINAPSIGLALALSVLALVAACKGRPEVVSQPNAEYKVHRLFTHDGCTLYRFHDGSDRYFAKCVDGKAADTFWTEGGKYSRGAGVDGSSTGQGLRP